MNTSPSLIRRLRAAAGIALALASTASTWAGYRGFVIYNGVGIPNTPVVYTTGSSFFDTTVVVNTDVNGFYHLSASSLIVSTATIYPTKPGYTFSPASQSVPAFTGFSDLNLPTFFATPPPPTLDPIADVTGYQDTVSIVPLSGIGKGDNDL